MTLHKVNVREDAGQALVMVALSMSVLLGAAGLVVDIGAGVRQHRSLRNGADAAALTGALAVAQQQFTTIQRDIVDLAERNGVPDTNGTSFDGVNGNVTWSYIGNNDADTTQAAATGVRVHVIQSWSTHFLSLIGISTIPLAADAVASVERLTGQGATAPFAVYEFQGGVDLLARDGSGKITGLNPAAIGPSYQVHGPQVADPFQPNRFKGRLPLNGPPFSVGDSIDYDHGDIAGPTRDEVKAIGTPYVILPIFDGNGTDPDKVHVLGFAAFMITPNGANKDYGVIVAGTFIGNGSGARDWAPGQTFDVVTLKLVR